jgi:hypothetical protein
MNLQEQKHYYGFVNLPNHWVDDNDNSYSDKFFDDRQYEEFYFDNFHDMDQKFGHENSLFGTKGLPVGHPKRTSKSFDHYNKVYGPMVVRVVKDKRLQEQIRRILKEEISSEVKYLIYIYFCDYEDHRFREFVSKFENMDIDFWVKPGKGHHRGFAIQSILNTHSKKRALDIANKIYDEFNQDILIVLSKQKVTNLEPIGMNNDKVFIKPGRYFDKLVDKKEIGIYML